MLLVSSFACNKSLVIGQECRREYPHSLIGIQRQEPSSLNPPPPPCNSGPHPRNEWKTAGTSRGTRGHIGWTGHKAPFRYCGAPNLADRMQPPKHRRRPPSNRAAASDVSPCGCRAAEKAASSSRRHPLRHCPGILSPSLITVVPASHRWGPPGPASWELVGTRGAGGRQTDKGYIPRPCTPVPPVA